MLTTKTSHVHHDPGQQQLRHQVAAGQEVPAGHRDARHHEQHADQVQHHDGAHRVIQEVRAEQQQQPVRRRPARLCLEDVRRPSPPTRPAGPGEPNPPRAAISRSASPRGDGGRDRADREPDLVAAARPGCSRPARRPVRAAAQWATANRHHEHQRGDRGVGRQRVRHPRQAQRHRHGRRRPPASSGGWIQVGHRRPADRHRGADVDRREDGGPKTPSAPCGSSMIPAAMQPPTTGAPSRGRARPPAPPPRSSARAYVMPAATWMTFAFSPATSSTSTNCGKLGGVERHVRQSTSRAAAGCRAASARPGSALLAHVGVRWRRSEDSRTYAAHSASTDEPAAAPDPDGQQPASAGRGRARRSPGRIFRQGVDIAGHRYILERQSPRKPLLNHP